MEKGIRVIFLLIGDLHRASSRYRVYQYLPYFRNIIPDVEWSAEESASLVKRAQLADIVFIQKAFFSPPFLEAIRKEGARLVYDFDDTVYVDSDFATQVNEKSEHFKRFQIMLEHCDLILAGNAYLKKFADQYHRRVLLIPTTVDVLRYPLKQHILTGNLSIGWSGHSSNQHYLELLKDPLVRLNHGHLNWTFRVISDQPWSARGIPVEFRQWDLDYLKELEKLDIGVMPLFKNDEWAKGKCACKALQYMASGTPAVISPVGMNLEVVKEGYSGFFAATPEEWFVKLLGLLTNADLRRRVGKAGREYVENHFAAHYWAAWLEDLLVSEAANR